MKSQWNGGKATNQSRAENILNHRLRCIQFVFVSSWTTISISMSALFSFAAQICDFYLVSVERILHFLRENCEAPNWLSKRFNVVEFQVIRQCLIESFLGQRWCVCIGCRQQYVTCQPTIYSKSGGVLNKYQKHLSILSVLFSFRSDLGLFCQQMQCGDRFNSKLQSFAPLNEWTVPIRSRFKLKDLLILTVEQMFLRRNRLETDEWTMNWAFENQFYDFMST